MSNFFDDMAAMAADILKPASEGGLGAEAIYLVRRTPPTQPTISTAPPGEPTVAKTKLAAQAFGVSKKLVGVPTADGTAIRASDLQVTAARLPVAYMVGDTLEIDGVQYQILQYSNIVAAGNPSAVEFIVRR